MEKRGGLPAGLLGFVALAPVTTCAEFPWPDSPSPSTGAITAALGWPDQTHSAPLTNFTPFRQIAPAWVSIIRGFVTAPDIVVRPEVEIAVNPGEAGRWVIEKVPIGDNRVWHFVQGFM